MKIVEVIQRILNLFINFTFMTHPTGFYIRVLNTGTLIYEKEILF